MKAYINIKVDLKNIKHKFYVLKLGSISLSSKKTAPFKNMDL